VGESTLIAGHAVRTLVCGPIGAAYDQKYIFEKTHSSGRLILVLCARGVGPLVRIEGIHILDTNVVLLIVDKSADKLRVISITIRITI